MSDTPIDEVAYHEAGHAVVSVVLGFTPETVTIVAEGNAAGYSGSSTGINAPGAFDQMIISYAGFAANMRHRPESAERARRGSENDDRMADHCVSLFHLSPGEPEELRRLKREEAEKLVHEHWGAIERVAIALLDRQTLHSEELVDLVKGHRRPD